MVLAIFLLIPQGQLDDSKRYYANKTIYIIVLQGATRTSIGEKILMIHMVN